MVTCLRVLAHPLRRCRVVGHQIGVRGARERAAERRVHDRDGVEGLRGDLAHVAMGVARDRTELAHVAQDCEQAAVVRALLDRGERGQHGLRAGVVRVVDDDEPFRRGDLLQPVLDHNPFERQDSGVQRHARCLAGGK